MNLDTLLSPDAVICDSEVRSKKRALEVLAEQLAGQIDNSQDDDAEPVDALNIFQLLTEREKLGSTSMGHGVALPHARTDLTSNAIGAFLKLGDGIDFDSPDGQATDLVFALIVPEHYTDEHLKILAHLASLFSDDRYCQALRSASSKGELYDRLVHWQLASEAS